MALHRDIFWVGRQWAVTGHGMQAVDQRLNGKFDVETARLWDDDPRSGLREQKWFNAEDFDRGLAEARKRYPRPPHATPPRTAEIPAVPSDGTGADEGPVEVPASALTPFAMRADCRGRLLRSWRVRIR